MFSLGIAGPSDKSGLSAVLETCTTVRLVKIVQSGGIRWALKSLGAPNSTASDSPVGEDSEIFMR
jgi:hypothetical protein